MICNQAILSIYLEGSVGPFEYTMILFDDFFSTAFTPDPFSLIQRFAGYMPP